MRNWATDPTGPYRNPVYQPPYKEPIYQPLYKKPKKKIGYNHANVPEPRDSHWLEV